MVTALSLKKKALSLPGTHWFPVLNPSITVVKVGVGPRPECLFYLARLLATSGDLVTTRAEDYSAICLDSSFQLGRAGQAGPELGCSCPELATLGKNPLPIPT